MKKFLSFIMALTLLLSLCACNRGTDDSSTAPNINGNVINITEKLYVSYINDIYTNTNDYVGKTIKIEGMYTAGDYKDVTYYYVYRIGPGCCGTDGNMCGFEFTYDGKMPSDNDWIEVTGTLSTYELDGETYLTLDAQSIKVLDTRGAETVAQ